MAKAAENDRPSKWSHLHYSRILRQPHLLTALLSGTNAKALEYFLSVDTSGELDAPVDDFKIDQTPSQIRDGLHKNPLVNRLLSPRISPGRTRTGGIQTARSAARRSRNPNAFKSAAKPHEHCREQHEIEHLTDTLQTDQEAVGGEITFSEKCSYLVQCFNCYAAGAFLLSKLERKSIIFNLLTGPRDIVGSLVKTTAHADNAISAESLKEKINSISPENAADLARSLIALKDRDGAVKNSATLALKTLFENDRFKSRLDPELLHADDRASDAAVKLASLVDRMAHFNGNAARTVQIAPKTLKTAWLPLQPAESQENSTPDKTLEIAPRF